VKRKDLVDGLIHQSESNATNSQQQEEDRNQIFEGL